MYSSEGAHVLAEAPERDPDVSDPLDRPMEPDREGQPQVDPDDPPVAPNPDNAPGPQPGT